MRVFKIGCFILFLFVGNYFSIANNVYCFGNDAFEDSSILNDSTFKLLKKIPVQSTYLTVDNLQNLYVATQKGQILKYIKNGIKQFEYNNNRLGKIGKIDAHNPLNILVYYPDLEVVIILDRTLSVIRELNLLDLDIIEPKAITIANDNNIWLFDEVTAVLKKIDQKGKTLFESRNLNQVTRKNLNPSFLQESNNLLYLSDAANGFFVFDTYGQLKQEIPIKGIERFEVIGQQIYYWKAEKLFTISIDVLNGKEIEIPLPTTKIENAIIKGNQVYITKKDSLEIYAPISKQTLNLKRG